MDHNTNLRNVTIALTPRAIARWGAQEAIVLQQVACWAEWQPDGEDGWFTASYSDLAALTGLSVETVRRCVRKLGQRGALEKRANVGSGGQTRSSFRVAVDLETGDQLATRPGVDSDTPRGVDSDTRTYVLDNLDNYPPTPLKGGGTAAQPSLLDEQPKRPRSRRPTERSAQRQVIDAAFESWWDAWPAKGHGQKHQAREAWAKRIEAGADRHRAPLSVPALRQRLSHYLEARDAYRALWGTNPPTLHAATFINSKSGMFADPWGREDLEYWPAPEGRSWASLETVSIFAALDAEIAREDAAANG